MKNLLRYFHPTLKSSSLKKKPQRFVVGDTSIVLFRNKSNTVNALLDRCPHRFTPLSNGRVNDEGRLTCPYHGWHFSGDGSGLNPNIPGEERCQVRAFQVIEKYGFIWVAHRGTAIENFPIAAPKDMPFVVSYRTVIDTPIHVALANFSENEHFPYVHWGVGWGPEEMKKVHFEYQKNNEDTEVFYRGPQRKFLGMRFFGYAPDDVLHNRWRTRFDPLCSTFDIHIKNAAGDTKGIRTHIPSFFTPQGPDKTHLHVFFFASFASPQWNFLLPALKRSLLTFSKKETKLDIKLCEAIGMEIPESFKGMDLRKYDRPVVDHDTMMRQLYFGESHKERLALSA